MGIDSVSDTFFQTIFYWRQTVPDTLGASPAAVSDTPGANSETVAIIEMKHRVHVSLLKELVEKKVAREYGVGVVRQDGEAVEEYGVPLKAY